MSESETTPKTPKRYFAFRVDQALYARLEAAAKAKTEQEGTEFRPAHIVEICVNKHLPSIEKTVGIEG